MVFLVYIYLVTFPNALTFFASSRKTNRQVLINLLIITFSTLLLALQSFNVALMHRMQKDRLHLQPPFSILLSVMALLTCFALLALLLLMPSPLKCFLGLLLQTTCSSNLPMTLVLICLFLTFARLLACRLLYSRNSTQMLMILHVIFSSLALTI